MTDVVDAHHEECETTKEIDSRVPVNDGRHAQKAMQFDDQRRRPELSLRILGISTVFSRRTREFRI